MCLVAISWKNHPQYPLIIRANRDEFFDRPSAKIHLWESGFFGGKDLKSGGTWMGFHPNGRWALLTNYRDFNNPRKAQISRGKLVQDFLETTVAPKEYLASVEAYQDQYDGFNLLVSDGEKLFYSSNFGKGIMEVAPGIHGLSNGLLNDPWPKVELAKSELNQQTSEHFTVDSLLDTLISKKTYSIDQLPDTGVPEEMEIGLSAQFIRLGDNYGTVSSTALTLDKSGKVWMKERSFQPDYSKFTDETYSFYCSNLEIDDPENI
ncbi:NRDE family protein [Algoriphagus sp. SE2]|uniref:NRDE family protein n=1 Tax=Algoriphagus sp. SE2 TaxID=3141536 RepID=UPI0031CCE637